jgi:hypothetical protein
MQTVTSIRAASVPEQELDGILADYVTLDRTRIFRRLLVLRCAALAALTAIVGLVVPGVSRTARVGAVGVFLVGPVWAWVTELRLSYRLSRRLVDVESSTQQSRKKFVTTSLDLCSKADQRS